jgi:hypothetical protein
LSNAEYFDLTPRVNIIEPTGNWSEEGKRRTKIKKNKKDERRR